MLVWGDSSFLPQRPKPRHPVEASLNHDVAKLKAAFLEAMHHSPPSKPKEPSIVERFEEIDGTHIATSDACHGGPVDSRGFFPLDGGGLSTPKGLSREDPVELSEDGSPTSSSHSGFIE